MNTTFKHSIQSQTLVCLQFILIFTLLYGTMFIKINCIAILFLIGAALLIFWSIFAMRKSKFRIMPEPSANAILIINGPYRFIRHPMYTAVLLFCVGLLICNFSIIRFLLIVALTVVLIIKLSIEENLLVQKFKAYREYCNHTSKLFPLVF